MFCNKCGKEASDADTFCARCGAKIIRQQVPVTPPAGAAGAAGQTRPYPAQPAHAPAAAYTPRILTPQDWKKAIIVGVITMVAVIAISFLLVALLRSDDSSFKMDGPDHGTWNRPGVTLAGSSLAEGAGRTGAGRSLLNVGVSGAVISPPGAA